MKKILSYFLIIVLCLIHILINGIIEILKLIQKPLQIAIEKLDKIIYKLNSRS